MANLTRDASLRLRNPAMIKAEMFTLDNSAAQSIFRGQPMIIDASADTNYVRGWVSTTTLVTANDKFIGIAVEPATVLTTDVETNNEIEIYTHGEVGFKSAVFTEADIGKAVGFTDSATLAAVAAVGAANACPIGVLTRVVDGYAYVRLNAPVILSF